VTTPFLLRAAYGLVASMAQRVDRKKGWDSLPRLRGGAVLFGLRYNLRQLNLYDTPAPDPPKRTTFIPRVTVRTTSGIGNDIDDREMGAAGTPFGRNGPAFPQNGSPSATEISNKLLARPRDGFQPAESLNLLAAAWVQFEVHDWMQHQPRADQRRHAAGDPLIDGSAALTQVNGSPAGSPRFVSDQTHWWDASQLYGADERFAQELRADRGRVKEGDALLETIESSLGRSPAPVPNLWVGLALFHLLFAKEHNAICAALEKFEPQLNDDARFEKARLINAALMAKIHTVEWTPAIIAHPTTEHAIRATWWGVFGERWRKRGLRLPGEVLSGIPGSRTHYDGVRYSLTEEFVAVYRMHPLIPDEVEFHRLDGGPPHVPMKFADLTVGAGPPDRPRAVLHDIGCADAWYSLGLAHPGQIALHNYPQFLRELPQPPRPGERGPRPPVDLAARDIERTRETALPRYNDFRRLFRLKPAESYYELANEDWDLARDIEAVYGKDNVNEVDLMVGLFAERKPDGFAFSDTAFRVFLLMAARRLRSDRFFTTDFTPAVYTATGLKRIQDRTMAQMLAEHFPLLASKVEHASNVFKPWPEDC
jgi:heme peroxidase